MLSDRLHIGMVVPPYYAVPPEGYGGIETTVASLVDALVQLGHRVTLISAGRNGTKGQQIQTYAEPQHERLGQLLPELVHVASAERALANLDVDVVHNHTLAGLLLGRSRDVPTVATVHGPLQGDLLQLYSDVDGSVHLVAISDSQRGHAPHLNWCSTVHNAVDPNAFIYREDKEDFVLFLGRMTPDKGVSLAIAAARAAGRRLVLAAKCSEPGEREYFEEAVRPLLADGEVEHLGEVEGQKKLDLLAAASALLFPIQWEEPFGMVMIEAMASGTPVVALRRGAVPEVVVDGVTGLICDNPEDLPEALHRARELEPAACRRRVVEHFSPSVIARGYEHAYRAAIGGHRSSAPPLGRRDLARLVLRPKSLIAPGS